MLKSWNLHFFINQWKFKVETWKNEKAWVFQCFKCSVVRPKPKSETWKNWLFRMFNFSTFSTFHAPPPPTDINNKLKVEKLKSWKLKCWKWWKVETSKVETSWNVEELKVEKMKGWTIETCIFLTKHWQLKFKTWKHEKARVFENVKCSSVRSKSKGETWKHWIFNMFKLSTCQLLTPPPYR